MITRTYHEILHLGGATFALMAALSLAGCATPFRAPADVADVRLERKDSPHLIVDKIWLERKHGPLVVTGSVLKRLDAPDTLNSSLEVSLLDAEGRVLRRTEEQFEPRQIMRRHRRPPLATYRVPLDPLPAGLRVIEVRAVDAPERLSVPSAR